MPKKNKYAFLRGEIKKKYNTEAQFATALGISQQSLSSKLHSKTSFSQKEMKKIINILDLNEIDTCKCFFSE